MKKIFGTDGIRCITNQEPMTAETCLKIAKILEYQITGKNLLTTKFSKKKITHERKNFWANKKKSKKIFKNINLITIENGLKEYVNSL